MNLQASAPHDPGGKIELRLQPGIVGDAEFYGDRQEYRLWLSRFWGEQSGPYALWIAMNPSTARADVDDPTIRLECNYSQRHLQVCGLMKCNVMDYRATRPATLLATGVAPRSDRNVETILRLAAGAQRIIVASGAVHPKLQCHADAVIGALQAEGYDLLCLGLTKNGSPRHPLRFMTRDHQLISFPWRKR